MKKQDKVQAAPVEVPVVKHISPDQRARRIKELRRLLKTKHLTDSHGVKLTTAEYRVCRKEMENELTSLMAFRAEDLIADMFDVAVSIAADVHPEDITPHERQVFQQVADFLSIDLDKVLPSS